MEMDYCYAYIYGSLLLLLLLLLLLSTETATYDLYATVYIFALPHTGPHLPAMASIEIHWGWGANDGGAEARRGGKRRGERFLKGARACNFFLKFYTQICTFWCFLAPLDNLFYGETIPRPVYFIGIAPSTLFATIYALNFVPIPLHPFVRGNRQKGEVRCNHQPVNEADFRLNFRRLAMTADHRASFMTTTYWSDIDWIRALGLTITRCTRAKNASYLQRPCYSGRQ